MEKIKEKLEEGIKECDYMMSDAPGELKVAKRYFVEALSLIDKMEKGGMWIEIPKPLSNAECHFDCPLCHISPANEWKYCVKRLDDDSKPGPGCPRYKGER